MDNWEERFIGVPSTALVRELIGRIVPKGHETGGLNGTPERVVKSWGELYAGYGQSPADILKMFDEEGYDEIVLVKGVEVRAVCEHHMLPFVGYAHVAYIADGKIVGLSKLARIVDCFARRLTVQERIGMQVANALMTYVTKKAAACVITCTHTCMRCRGVNQVADTTTSAMLGAFREDARARAELLAMIGKV